MRLDINIQGGPAPGDDSDFKAAQLGSQMGGLLARMSHDYPTQMIARVAVDNGDGTYDCDRPGTDIYMSRVETISPRLVQQLAVGVTVLIRFFRRDRQKPYIVRVAGGVLDEVVANLPWVCARGNFRNTFVAGRPGGIIAVTETPRQLDTYASNGVIVGILQYTLDDQQVVALHTAVSAHSTGADLFLAALSLGMITSSSSYLWTRTVAGQPGVIVNGYACWVYCEELDRLVWGRSNQFVLLNAATGALVKQKNVSFTTGSLALAGDVLIQTLNGSPRMLAHQLPAVDAPVPDVTLLWDWDPDSIWTGSTPAPALHTINMVALVSGIQQPASTTAPWPYGLGNGHLLPGCPPVVVLGEESNLVIQVATGNILCSTTPTPWVNPAWPAQETIQRYVDGQFDAAGGHFGLSWGVMMPTYATFGLGGRTDGQFGGSLNGGAFLVGRPNNPSGSPLFDAQNFSSGIGSNSRYLYSWIIALDSVTGVESFRIALPILDAQDATNYEVDSASFALVGGSPHITDFDTQANIDGAGGTCTAVVTSSSSVVFPDQVYMSNYADAGLTRQFSIDGTSLASKMHWPPGAKYMWDPVMISSAGEMSGGLFAFANSHGNLVADRDGEFLYGCYLRPKIIVSCLDVRHRTDASITDRTHTGNTDYSTILNGYESDRVTLKSQVNVWAKVNQTYTAGAPNHLDIDATFYGEPHRFIVWRSFLGKWSVADQELVESVELTTTHADLIDATGMSVPYPGVTLRICPTNAGLFLLRLERLSIKTGIREACLLPSKNTGNYTAVPAGNDFQNHLFNSKAVLELRNPSDLSVLWKQTIYDPTALAPIWLCGCSLYASESSLSASLRSSWCIGRVDFSTDYTAKTLWMDNPANYGTGLTRASKIFSCNAAGDISIRDAVAGDLDSQGLWPYDFLNTQAHNNGRARQMGGLLMDGALQYPSGTTDFDLWTMGG